MGKNLAYLRTSTDKQDLNNQKVEVLEYACCEGIHSVALCCQLATDFFTNATVGTGDDCDWLVYRHDYLQWWAASSGLKTCHVPSTILLIDPYPSKVG